MTEFDTLIGLIDKLDEDEFGTWVVDHEHKGTSDDPIHLPFPVYSEAVDEFIKAVYDFNTNNPNFELTKYYELMEERKIKNIDDSDIEALDAQGTMALLMWVVRGERFCDGLILSKFQDGKILALLKHLKRIVEK